MNILIFPNDPFELYEKKGHDDWYPNYFNPNGIFDKTFLSYRWDKDVIEERCGLTLLKTKIRNNTIGKVLSILIQINQAIKIVKENNIEVVRAYNTTTVEALIVSKITKTKLVISVHNDYEKERLIWHKSKVKRFLLEKLENIIIKKSDQIRCVSTFLYDYVIRKGADKNKVKLTFNKVKLDKFKKVDISRKEDTFNFLFIGRLTKQKNLITLLEAYSKLLEDRKDINLTLVGDGDERKKIEAFIKLKNIEDKVEVTGFIKNSELTRFHSNSKCFILPSYFEGFGVVLIEAQASGLPIICSDIPAVKDIVNSDNSLIFNPNDSQELYRCMKLILESNDLLNKLSNKSFESSKKFEWNRIERYEADLYKEIIEKYVIK